MSERFHIEDLIVQDASGVVFRATDKHSSKAVAVRRFFPFGPNGGGLRKEEQTAYMIAVERLADLSHPALRAVIGGGCDPVDGMPYLTTEWVDGDSLPPSLSRSPLSVELATELITQALEVCELLSHLLAEEAVWIETKLESIVVGDEQSGRRFTFWISPVKWLSGDTKNRGLEAIVTLTEEIMGWKGQIINDVAGQGLGAWLKWLRNNASTASLRETREMLAASIGAEPPEPMPDLVSKAIVPAIRPNQRNSPGTKFALPGTIGLAAAITLIGWLWFHKRNQAQELTIPPIAPAMSRIDEVNDRATQLANEAREIREKEAATLRDQETQAQRNGGVISWEHHELLVTKNNERVIVEGSLKGFKYTANKKTLYLLFSNDPDRDDARGAIRPNPALNELSATGLVPLLGKNIRLHGEIFVRRSSGLNRPEIEIKDRASIQTVD